MLRAGASRPPLVLIPGQLGHALLYRGLARAFGPEQPVCGLQLPGVDSSEPVIDLSIEEMADMLEPQVLGAYPSGPIILGGYSMGALLAFELALRFQRRGRDVPLLISIDGFAPGYPAPALPAARARAHLHALRAAPITYARERLAGLQGRVLALFGQEWRVAAAGPDALAQDPAQRARTRKSSLLRLRASARYRSDAAAELALLLIRSTEPQVALGATLDASYGWRPFVQGPSWDVVLEGSHPDFLDSPATQVAIARAIERRIEETCTRTGDAAAPSTLRTD
jgi:thioesterase domain-containing protein